MKALIAFVGLSLVGCQPLILEPIGSGGSGGGGGTPGMPGSSTGGAASSSGASAPSSTSTGSGPMCPIVSGSVCDGVFDGAPGQLQPVWATCVDDQAYYFGLDSDGTSVALDYLTGATILDADGRGIGAPTLAFSGVLPQHQDNWIRFASALGGGPSDLIVSRDYSGATGLPLEHVIERFDRAGTLLWSYSFGRFRMPVGTPRPSGNGSLFFAVQTSQKGSDETQCGLVELDGAGQPVTPSALPTYPDTECAGLASDGAGNLYLGLRREPKNSSQTVVKVDPARGEVWSTVVSKEAVGTWKMTKIVGIGVSASGEATAILWRNRANGATSQNSRTFTRLDASGAIVSKVNSHGIDSEFPLAVESYAVDPAGNLFLMGLVQSNSREYGVDFTSAGEIATAIAKFSGGEVNADWGVGIAASDTLRSDMQVDGAGTPYVLAASLDGHRFVARLKATPSCPP